MVASEFFKLANFYVSRVTGLTYAKSATVMYYYLVQKAEIQIKYSERLTHRNQLYLKFHCSQNCFLHNKQNISRIRQSRTQSIWVRGLEQRRLHSRPQTFAAPSSAPKTSYVCHRIVLNMAHSTDV